MAYVSLAHSLDFRPQLRHEYILMEAGFELSKPSASGLCDTDIAVTV